MASNKHLKKRKLLRAWWLRQTMLLLGYSYINHNVDPRFSPSNLRVDTLQLGWDLMNENQATTKAKNRRSDNWEIRTTTVRNYRKKDEMGWKKVIITRPLSTKPEDRQGLGGLSFTAQKENMYIPGF